MAKTAHIEYRKSYFNTVAYAHIPGGYVVVPHDGTFTFGCEPTREHAERAARDHGYAVVEKHR